MRTGDAECIAEGHARRNPQDPNVPRIGEELATGGQRLQATPVFLETLYQPCALVHQVTFLRRGVSYQ